MSPTKQNNGASPYRAICSSSRELIETYQTAVQNVAESGPFISGTYGGRPAIRFVRGRPARSATHSRKNRDQGC